MIEHCMAALRRKNEKTIRDIYITDVLRLISESTAKFAGGSMMKVRYADLIKQQKEDRQPKSEESAEEIIARISGFLSEMGQ